MGASFFIPSQALIHDVSIGAISCFLIVLFLDFGVDVLRDGYVSVTHPRLCILHINLCGVHDTGVCMTELMRCGCDT